MALDLEALKLKPTAGIIKTTPLLKVIKVRKPHNTEFFRVREGDEWVMDFPIFSPLGAGKGKDTEKYLVMPAYQQELDERKALQYVRFFFCIGWGSNIYFLSDVGIKTSEDGTLNSYHKSRLELYELAKKKWISISANMDLGAYTATEAKSNIAEPEWGITPFKNIGEAIQLAFKDNVIDNESHPVLKKLRGEV